MAKICPICGKEFEGNRKYCNKECSKKGYYLVQARRIENKKKAKQASAVKDNRLQIIAKEARKAGMSYGQYVALQNHAASFRKEKQA